MATGNQHRVTREKLDAFPVPVSACIVVYDQQTRKALFFHKKKNGYELMNTYNKRRDMIRVRQTDYLLTMDFDGILSPGDTKGVFTREMSA